MIERAQTLLAIPDSFRTTALSFPDKVSQALALIDSPKAAKELLARADAMSVYANRVKADKEIMDAIGYGRLKIIARLGELIPATPKKETGRGNKKSSGNGTLSPPTASRYRKVTAHEKKLDEFYQTCKDGETPVALDGFIRFATGTEKAGRAAHVSANTGVPEWYTPVEYIESSRTVLGNIELDPASSKVAQRTVKANKFFTLDDDGLSKPWRGRVFLNPPYASDLIQRFVEKLCEHFAAKDVDAAILLTNNATETKWFQSAAIYASAMCFPAGRIRFIDEQGNAGGAPLQGQAFTYFGSKPASFRKEFKQFGFCVTVDR